VECTADWQINPAPLLFAVAVGQNAQVNAPGPGSLTAVTTVVLSRKPARAAATSCPQIAPVRVTVTRPGPVTIRLKLNAAAKGNGKRGF